MWRGRVRNVCIYAKDEADGIYLLYKTVVRWSSVFLKPTNGKLQILVMQSDFTFTMLHFLLLNLLKIQLDKMTGKGLLWCRSEKWIVILIDEP